MREVCRQRAKEKPFDLNIFGRKNHQQITKQDKVNEQIDVLK